MRSAARPWWLREGRRGLGYEGGGNNREYATRELDHGPVCDATHGGEVEERPANMFSTSPSCPSPLAWCSGRKPILVVSGLAKCEVQEMEMTAASLCYFMIYLFLYLCFGICTSTVLILRTIWIWLMLTKVAYGIER